MTSSDFELMARREALKALREHYDEGRVITIDGMHVVWFAHVLGNKKCLIWPQGTSKYIEVTYNYEAGEMYIDIYEKTHKTTAYSFPIQSPI